MGLDTPPKEAEKTLVIDIMFWGKSPTILNLEIDMIKFPTILTRRSMFRAGAGLTVAATATPLLTPASAQAEDAPRQAGA